MEKLVRAKANQVQATNITIVVLAIDLSHVAVSICSHEHIQLFPHRIHLWFLQSPLRQTNKQSSKHCFFSPCVCWDRGRDSGPLGLGFDFLLIYPWLNYCCCFLVYYVILSLDYMPSSSEVFIYMTSLVCDLLVCDVQRLNPAKLWTGRYRRSLDQPAKADPSLVDCFFFKKKNIFKNFNIFLFFSLLQINLFFYIYKSFWYTDVKNNF